jgi:hypothetical protein
MPTLLADLVRRQTAGSLLSVFSRTIDRVAEELAQDLLRDPGFRAEMQALVRVAFTQALTELQAQAPPNTSHQP